MWRIISACSIETGADHLATEPPSSNSTNTKFLRGLIINTKRIVCSRKSRAQRRPHGFSYKIEIYAESGAA